VHAPLQVPRKYRNRFRKIEDEKRQTFAAMLSAQDDGVGAVLAKLREADLEDNTLLFFHSDNGGPSRQTTSRNDPLRGFKGQVLEGGIRIPFLVQWKGQLPAGKVYDRPVIALDIHSTAVAAAGAKLPENAKLDGVNLVPYLKGDTDRPPHEMLLWRFGPQSAVRKGDWKLVHMNNKGPRLYNLAEDIGEKNDLAGEKPELVKELEAALKQWDGQLAKPLWERPQR
jgi:arylsulfatase A-like enzyme